MRFLAFIILVAHAFSTFVCVNGIVRGYDAASGQFPYVVRLKVHSQTDDDILCGGSLISPTWILTAAHCFDEYISAEVYLGSIFKDNAEVVYNVTTSEITVYPYYYKQLAHNDIALIKIPPTDLDHKISKVALPKIQQGSYSKYEKAFATACGWGRKSSLGNLSERLQCGRVRIEKNKHCEFEVYSNEIWTGMAAEFATTCVGDSGGPLVLEATGELIGIIKLSDPNCEDGVPAVHTRITLYLDWIKSVSGVAY